jgi:hypothetical protein
MTISRRTRFACSLVCALVVAGQAHAQVCDDSTIMVTGFETVPGLRFTSMTDAVDRGWAFVSAEYSSTTRPVRAGMFWASLADPLAPNAVVEIRAGSGSFPYDFVQLAAYVGTADHIVASREADGWTRVGRIPALSVTAESTARWSLLREQFAGIPYLAHQCAFQALAAGLDQAEVRRRTAVLQLLIEDGALPPGVEPANNTIEVFSDAQRLQAVVAALDAASPGRILQRMELLARPLCSHLDGRVVMLQRERQLGRALNIAAGELLEMDGAGSGSHLNVGGEDSFVSSCADDIVSFDLQGLREIPTFPTRNVSGVLQQVEGRQVTTYKQMARIATWPYGLLTARLANSTMTFPNHPQLAPETGWSESRMVLPVELGSMLFAAQPMAGAHVLPSRSVVGYRSGHRVHLYADGSGADIDDGFGVAWAVGESGALLLDFLGDDESIVRSAELIPFRQEASGVVDTITVMRDSAGKRSASVGLALRSGPVARWLRDDEVDGHYVAFAWRTHGRNPPFNYMTLQAPRTVQQTIQDEFGTYYSGAQMHWSRPGPGHLVMRRCVGDDMQQVVVLDREPLAGECTRSYIHREWQLFQVHETCYYVFEERRSWTDLDPASGAPPNGGHSDFSAARVYARMSETPDHFWHWNRKCELPESQQFDGQGNSGEKSFLGLTPSPFDLGPALLPER